jgi:hypothetical protein
MPRDGARAVTLDEHLREQSVPRVELIKIDVDGAECSSGTAGNRARPGRSGDQLPFA